MSREGSVDWLCLPRFDSDACMAALIGRDEHGCWRVYPSNAVRAIRRRYHPGTLILETDFECDGGTVRLVDFMPFGKHSLLRVIEGLEGTVTLDVELGIRFGYGRYKTEQTKDGLAGSEGAFLACSFWLVDAYVYSGRRREAERLFERLLALRNDLGLLAEEYDPRTGRLVGNFPQAFSHLALIHSASVLDADQRARGTRHAA